MNNVPTDHRPTITANPATTNQPEPTYFTESEKAWAPLLLIGGLIALVGGSYLWATSNDGWEEAQSPALGLTLAAIGAAVVFLVLLFQIIRIAVHPRGI